MPAILASFAFESPTFNYYLFSLILLSIYSGTHFLHSERSLSTNIIIGSGKCFSQRLRPTCAAFELNWGKAIGMAGIYPRYTKLSYPYSCLSSPSPESYCYFGWYIMVAPPSDGAILPPNSY